MNSLDENTVNAPGDEKLKAKVSVKIATGAQQEILPQHPMPPPLCWLPRLLDPSFPFLFIPLTAFGSWEDGRVSLPRDPVPTPSDHTLLPQQGKVELTDPSDKEVLVSALNLNQPRKTAYINTTFTTTDL